MSAEPVFVTKAKTAKAQRDASIPKEFLLSSSSLSNLSKDLTSIPRSHPHFAPNERTIITSSVPTLLKNLRSGQWTSEAVVRAFLKSAAVADQLTNCLTYLCADTAIARARKLDRLHHSGKLAGPFHGLPISLKDCFVTPPVPSALGLAVWGGESTENVPESVLVTSLEEHGAIIHAKTNVPVGMMMMETTNNVTGTTINPYNTSCSPGGSSGGESSLLALCGSPLGIGTDIGGSIRIPAAFCNLYSLKPSFGRLPTYRARSAIPGNEFIFSVNGPMARDLESVKLYCEALLGSDGGSSTWEHDPKCIPLPWRSDVKVGRKLKLAFMPPHDGVAHAHPPVIRALELCRRACESAGHIVTMWEPTGHKEMLASVEAGFFKLGGPAIGALLEKTGEPWFMGMQKYAAAAAADKKSRETGKGEGVLTAEELRAMNLIRNDLQKRHLDRWRDSGVDAIVAPVSPWSAVRDGLTTLQHGRSYIGYTAVWSLLDVSVGTVPVTKATKEDGWERVGGKPQAFSELDEGVIGDWDVETYEGTPVGLQVIGARLEEEKVLGMVGAVDEALRGFRETAMI